MPDRPLAERLRLQADQCARSGSALTGALLRGAADDLVAGGVVADLLGPLEADPPGSVPALRFAAAMHRLVLERWAPELALHYPSVGGTAPVEQVWPAAERAVGAHLDRLRELVRSPVQTNEVGRAAALYGVLCQLAAETGRPVRLLEIGTSAGLNLRCDAFAYEVADGVVLGDPDSPVRLRAPWQPGRHPAYDAVPRLVDRAGCDPALLDPATPDGRLTLTSCVWADQVERLERLRAALQVAQQVPARTERAGAADFLRRELARDGAGLLTVVWHSVVWQYLPAQERDDVDALLEAEGARRGPGAPLVRVAFEPERFGEVGTTFRVRVRSWPGGRSTHVADAEGHGPPVRWRRRSARLVP